MVVVDAAGSVAAGASSNGAIHEVPGRVGDAAVPGGGAYADSEVGGCGATGGMLLLVARSIMVACKKHCGGLQEALWGLVASPVLCCSGLYGGTSHLWFLFSFVCWRR
jgi:isoaspartyl peptidase/L-asparaginase-like protein (Ntn-hydrolase superfamily)